MRAVRRVEAPSSAVWWVACVLWAAAGLSSPPDCFRHSVDIECLEPVSRAGSPGGIASVICSGDEAPRGGFPVNGAPGLLFGRPVNLNCARQSDLDSLPGIGPARATAILETRRQTPFRSLQDLVWAPGVGPKTAARLRGWAVASGSGEGPGAHWRVSAGNASDPCRL